VAPYNTYYPKLEAHLAEVGVDTTVNSWDKLLTLGMFDPHDSISPSAGSADAQAEGAAVLPPERFTNFEVSILMLYLNPGVVQSSLREPKMEKPLIGYVVAYSMCACCD
jgi:hypothetical protein